MIILKLKGGLGNQLFQYAAAKQISLNNKVELLLDTVNGFINDPFERKYCLDAFAINSGLVDEKYINNFFIKNRYFKKIYVLSQDIYHLNDRTYIKEKSNEFDKDLYNLRPKRNVYLDGYFQTYLYFEDISNIIKNEFRFLEQPSISATEFLSEINITDSVSIHIRSFNNGKKNDTSKINGICGLNYYNKAIEYIKDRVKNPVFYIFSDNLEWARKNIISTNDSNFRFIAYQNNLGHDIDDFRLMSSCKYNIIANSTFSWWAAWLNKEPEKIVIAPSEWFASKSVNQKEIYPENWIKI
jgi:hypothetical protein